MAMSPLYGHLNRWMAMPFRWGESDCCLVLADWVQFVSGIDVAAALRQTYHDPGSCQRETGFLRDPLRVTTACMEVIGRFPRTTEPAAGDVAVVRALIGGRIVPFGAICLGPGKWAAKAERGIVEIRGRDLVEVVRAWSVGYEG